MTTQDEALGCVIGFLKEFIEGWDIDDDITSQTKFNVDLGFSSIDMLHYLAFIDMNLQKKHPFEQLIMTNGVYKNELSVAELAAFIFEHRNTPRHEPKAM
jgi:acyl carrier protein